jgi:hypothetical protein
MPLMKLTLTFSRTLFYIANKKARPDCSGLA